jgi:HAD superfamily hydrolase (TIGR01484 family)
MKPLLICTDLDRTLIHNGPQPLSPGAPELFARLAALEAVRLAYVTGRHRALIESAISEFGLPVPDFAIADVGATIYRTDRDGWTPWPQWEEHIAPDWLGLTSADLHALLKDMKGLLLQEEEKLSRHKLSYYVPLDQDRRALLREAGERLKRAAVHVRLIWSVDELAGVGLLDVLPARAGKLAAIRFLMEREGFGLDDTLFAGDSGNDLDVLASDIPAVLVANADAETRARLSERRKEKLHFASGYLGMNGNFAAGILEGAARFRPDVDAWLRETVKEI